MPHLLPHREAGNLTFLLYIQTLIRPRRLGPSSGREHLSSWSASRAHTPASWGPGAAHLPSPGASPALPLSQLLLRSSDLPPPPPHLPFAPCVTQVRLLPRQVPRNRSKQQLAVTCGPIEALTHCIPPQPKALGVSSWPYNRSVASALLTPPFLSSLPFTWLSGSPAEKSVTSDRVSPPLHSLPSPRHLRWAGEAKSSVLHGSISHPRRPPPWASNKPDHLRLCKHDIPCAQGTSPLI